MSAYKFSENIAYPDPAAASTNINNDTASGIIWRDALANGELKVLSASQFKGRVLGITSQGEIAWVDMSNPTTAFGELSVAQIQPVIQLSFLSGLEQKDTVAIETANGGTVIFEDQTVHIEIPAAANARALLRTQYVLQYRPGQGSLGRFTGRFSSTPQTNSRQFLGMGNIRGGFYFGYQNATFGIFHLNGGKIQLHQFTVTTAATAAQTATVTLNGVAVNVPLIDATEATLANRTAYTAYELAKGDYSSTGFSVESHGNVLYFFSTTAGPKTGTYSFSSTGNATATNTSLITGITPTETFVAQSSWNGDDIHDGSGASGFTLDPSKGNVYQVQFQWLGFGSIYFSVENPLTAKLEVVHIIRFPNTSLITSLPDPAVHIQMFVEANGGVPGGALTVNAGCFFAGIEGSTLLDFGPIKYSRQNNVTSIPANIVSPVLSVRNNHVTNARVANDVLRLLYISIGSDSNKPVEVFLIRNATLGNGTIDQSPTLIQDFPIWVHQDSLNSCASTSSQSRTLSGGTILLTFIVGKTDSNTIDVSKLAIVLRAGELITIAARTTNASNDITASLTWVEDLN